MNRESAEYYLQLLKISRGASEEDIRAAIIRELRLWTHRTNSHKLEVRQQAERMVAILEGAGGILLGRERQIWGQRHDEPDVTALSSQTDSPVEAELIARVVEQVASVRGRRSQERKGTAIYKRAAFFYKGVDYVREELTHKRYQAELDFKRCCAFQNALPLFDWHCRPRATPVRGETKVYVSGAWVTDLLAIGREIDSAKVKS